MRGLPSGPEHKTRKQVRQARQDEPSPETPDSHQKHYLTFRLNEQWCALSVYQLVEVLPPPKITRLPRVPDHIQGVINLRGEILSIIDLKRFLGLPRDRVAEAPHIIVVEHSGVRTGLLVDAVGDLGNLAWDDSTEEPLLKNTTHRISFERRARWGDIPVSIINLEGLLEAEKLCRPEEE